MDGYRVTFRIFDEGIRYWQDMLKEYPDLFKHEPMDYGWKAKPEPKQGYIDAGVVFSDVIQLSYQEIGFSSDDELKVLERLLTDMTNVEYFEDKLRGHLRVRAGVPCITTMEA